MRAISSAGSEHLPYKQGVTGSNPVSPTKPQLRLFFWAISSVGLERLLDRQEVTGSNPVLPTNLLNAPSRGFFINIKFSVKFIVSSLILRMFATKPINGIMFKQNRHNRVNPPRFAM